MPNTKITKEKLKNHWAYSKKIYILMTAVAVGLASILYTVVNNHNPADYKYVCIALVDSYSDTTRIERDAITLYDCAHAYDANLEKLDFLSIGYSGGQNGEMDYYGAQLYTVQLAGGECDMFIQSAELTNEMKDQGNYVPLDTLPSFELFAAKYPDAYTWETLNPVDGNGEPLLTEETEEARTVPHVYSIDVSQLTKLITGSVFDVRGKQACILARSANADTTLYALYQMFELFTESAQ